VRHDVPSATAVGLSASTVAEVRTGRAETAGESGRDGDGDLCCGPPGGPGGRGTRGGYRVHGGNGRGGRDKHDGQDNRERRGQDSGRPVGPPTPSAASACTPDQLTLTYRGGGTGAGNDMGTIVFRDTSGQACRFTGTVATTGLSAAGAPDTATIKATVVGPGLLSAHAAVVPDGASAPAGERVYGWLLVAEYRDGPASVDNGYCQPDWVIPASWRVTLPAGATVVVPNQDPGDVIGLHGAAGGLVTCRGQLDTPQRPASLDS
jgi:hypothetical protein